MPPSVTALGAYRLLLEAPIAAAPGWLLDMIRPKLTLISSDVANAPARIEVDNFDAQRRYALDVALPAAARAVASAPEGTRNQTLNDNVLALAGIAAHDPRLLDVQEVRFELSRAASRAGLFVEETFATMDSAWMAGLTKPRQDWPPRDRSAGLFFGDAPAGPRSPSYRRRRASSTKGSTRSLPTSPPRTPTAPCSSSTAPRPSTSPGNPPSRRH